MADDCSGAPCSVRTSIRRPIFQKRNAVYHVVTWPDLAPPPHAVNGLIDLIRRQPPATTYSIRPIISSPFIQLPHNFQTASFPHPSITIRIPITQLIIHAGPSASFQQSKTRESTVRSTPLLVTIQWVDVCASLNQTQTGLLVSQELRGRCVI